MMGGDGSEAVYHETMEPKKKKKEGNDLCVPRLVKFLDFGLDFRHEGTERSLASCQMGECNYGICVRVSGGEGPLE